MPRFIQRLLLARLTALAALTVLLTTRQLSGQTGPAIASPAIQATPRENLSPQELFDRGTQAYLVGFQDQAAEFFRQSARLAPSAGTLHNLGNAEWSRSCHGAAVLAWERAQWLDPWNLNTRANLRYARKIAQLDTPDLAWYELCSSWLPVNAWAWLAAFCFWPALALIVLPNLLGWKRREWRQGLAAAGFAIFLLTLPALFGVYTRTQLGVILEKDTPLRLTPTHDAQTMAKIPAGTLVRQERERGAFLYIRTPNSAAGWVKNSDFARICSSPE